MARRRSLVDIPLTDASVLPEAAAARLLTRASELEASGEVGFTVTELRVAAEEAGIPAHAFDAALAEHQGKQPAPPSGPASVVRGASRSRRWPWALAAAGTAALLLVLGVRLVSPAPAMTVEEALMLRCLTPGEAAELVRPLLRDGQSTVEYNPVHAPRVLTIRGTPDVLERAKALLAERERAGSSACTPASVAPDR